MHYEYDTIPDESTPLYWPPLSSVEAFAHGREHRSERANHWPARYTLALILLVLIGIAWWVVSPWAI